MNSSAGLVFFFFFNDRAPPEILPLPPPAPFPFFLVPADVARHGEPRRGALRVPRPVVELGGRVPEVIPGGIEERDRKSTRLNSSHSQISYAVFCLKKKKNTHVPHTAANQ